MALKDFLDLVDPKLAEVYNHVAPDPTKARKPFIRAIDRTIKQYEEGKQPRGDAKWWSANRGVVMFTPNIDGRALDFGKGNPMPVPAERFVNGLTKLRADVEAGELDSLLVDDGAEAPAKGKKAAASTGGSGRAGWSQERRDRHAATMAAKKAAAGK